MPGGHRVILATRCRSTQAAELPNGYSPSTRASQQEPDGLGEAIDTGKVAKNQLPASPLQDLDELLAKAPKIIPQPHWDKLSPMDKIKWYVDAAATPRYPLFESLLRDA